MSDLTPVRRIILAWRRAVPRNGKPGAAGLMIANDLRCVGGLTRAEARALIATLTADLDHPGCKWEG